MLQGYTFFDGQLTAHPAALFKLITTPANIELCCAVLHYIYSSFVSQISIGLIFCLTFTAVTLVCNFCTFAGGLVLVVSGLALRSCSTFEEYSDVFNKVVLPAFTKLVELGESSLCFTVQAETASALNELWKMYNNGTLKNRLQGFLVTEEVKQLATGEDVEVTVFIDEEQYKEAYLNLTLLQSQGKTTIIDKVI